MQLFEDGLDFKVSDEQQNDIFCREQWHEGQHKAFVELHAVGFRACVFSSVLSLRQSTKAAAADCIAKDA